MKTFLLDLLEDLREKRLIPVAILLAVGIVAVPVVLANGGSSSSNEEPTASKQAAGADPTAEAQIAGLVKSGGGKSTDLGKFGSKDPFKPPSGYASRPRTSDTATGDVSDGSDDTAAAEGGGSSDSPSSTAPAGTGGGEGGGKTKTTAYTYVADVTFSQNGKVTRRRLGRLAMLPSSSNPLLLFLGVTDGGDDAVFLVDSSLKAAGEGKCTPSSSQCANVYIGAGAEEEFTGPDGDSYTLRVDEIRKVKLASSAARKASPKKSARASSNSSRRFVPPVLADIVESTSSSSKEGR